MEPPLSFERTSILYTRNCSIKITKRYKILIAFIQAGLSFICSFQFKRQETVPHGISLNKITGCGIAGNLNSVMHFGSQMGF
jgi:hypothetical protein